MSYNGKWILKFVANMCFATRWCAVSLKSNKLKFINDKNPIDGVCVATFKLKPG